MRRRLKNFDYRTELMRVPEGSLFLYEFTIPRVVTSEGELKKVADKKGFTILEQIRMDGTPPVVRILRKIEPFTSTREADQVLQKSDRSFQAANTKIISKHVAIILSQEYNLWANEGLWWRGAKRFSITGTFTKTPDQEFKLKNTYVFAPNTIFFYKDKIDPENQWKVKFSMDVSEWNLNKMRTPGEAFVSIVRNQFGTTNFQTRFSLI